MQLPKIKLKSLKNQSQACQDTGLYPLNTEIAAGDNIFPILRYCRGVQTIVYQMWFQLNMFRILKVDRSKDKGSYSLCA